MSVFKTSKYIKKEELTRPVVLTIAGNELRNVGTEDKPDEKFCLSFEETSDFLTLNSSRGNQLAEDFGTFEMDEWIGRKVELSVDPKIKFGTKTVGGIVAKGVKE